jgi:uncharacterized membrane protein
MDSQQPPTPQTPQSTSVLQDSASPMTTCPVCHISVPASFFFCPNCGASLRPAPPVVTIKQQVSAYAVSLFLPPFGFWYVWKYIRSSEPKVKRVGIVALVLTIISIIVTVWMTTVTTGWINSINQAINQSLGSYGNLGL